MCICLLKGLQVDVLKSKHLDRGNDLELSVGTVAVRVGGLVFFSPLNELKKPSMNHAGGATGLSDQVRGIPQFPREAQVSCSEF